MYDHLTHDMATSINGMYDSRGLRPVHWTRELARLGLNERLYAGRLGELADRMEAAVPEAEAWTSDRGVRSKKVEAIAKLIPGRLAVLRGVSRLP